MSTAADIMGGGFSAGQAAAIGGQVSDTMTGAGTTQATGTAITASVSVFTTVTASTGGTLTDSMIGDQYDILNLGASTLTVYPPSGGRINQISTNGGFSLPINTACKVKKFTATRWMAWLSA